MNILADFKSLLTKGNATSLAVAVAVGMTVDGLADGINRSVTIPLLNMITGGGRGIIKLDTDFFAFGTLIATILSFAVAIAVIYAVFGILFPMLFGRTTDDSKDSAPLPPPPAPPV